MHSLLRILQIVGFEAALAIWSWALLSPNPVPETVRKEIGLDWQFVLSKLLHASGYTFLTLLGGSLARTTRGRWIIIALIAAHGAASEIGQATMDLGRHGSIRDVLIDWAGIAIGAMLLMGWDRITTRRFEHRVG